MYIKDPPQNFPFKKGTMYIYSDLMASARDLKIYLQPRFFANAICCNEGNCGLKSEQNKNVDNK